jgi:HEAT repeat protein
MSGADTPDEQLGALAKLLAIAPDLLALRDIALVAETVAALDALLVRVSDTAVGEAIGKVAEALTDPATVDRMVARLGEARVPPAERAALVDAVGALAALTVGRVLDAFLAAPPDMREPYRAAMRRAAERSIEQLQARLEDPRPEMVAAAVQFLGHSGNPQAIPLLTPLIRHRAEGVREAALLALAEIGGREIARPAIPPLKDESVLVRTAAAKAIGVAGDPASTTVLVRRLEQEQDEGVMAELLRSIGRLGAPEALEALARYAEPGSMMKRRTPYVRSAAIEGIGRLSRPEARALLELYSHDKEPTVRRAAEAMLK